MNFSRLFMFILAFALCLSGIVAAEKTLAFPGAEGFGAYSKGGRGGEVLFISTLEDYLPGKQKPIPGSFRLACQTQGPRTIIFRVSGTIELKAPIKITQPYLTIAGQSAPGDGICLKNHGFLIHTHDVIVRYIRCRPGDEVGRALLKQGQHWETDALNIGAPSRNVIIDHCSTSWANDEVLSVSGEGVTNITVQWSIISESLDDSTHEKGRHGYGSLIRTNGNVTFHHNLYAFHRSRSPRPGTYGKGSILLDFRNNVLHKGGQGYSSKDPVRMNFVANYHKTTPFKATNTCTHYSEGNIGSIMGGKKRDVPFDVPAVATTSAEEARAAVLASAGAVLPKRDDVDKRVVQLVKAGKGRLINAASDVGGWPKLISTAPYRDGDNDGMSDDWEAKNGLNPKKADHNKDMDRDGYTNIEEFLNGTNPQEE